MGRPSVSVGRVAARGRRPVPHVAQGVRAFVVLCSSED
jgi:hypothetical protein